MYKCIDLFNLQKFCNSDIEVYIYSHTRTCLYHSIEKELCLCMFSNNYECKVCERIHKQTLIHAYVNLNTYCRNHIFNV